MPELPIRRMILYKHGVGYFERRGAVSGTALRLSFPRAAMDDVLKSLVALDLGAGQVHGVDFETPEDRAAQIARGSIHLSTTAACSICCAICVAGGCGCGWKRSARSRKRALGCVAGVRPGFASRPKATGRRCPKCRRPRALRSMGW